MDTRTLFANQESADWHYAQSLETLQEKSVLMVRVNGKQLALFNSKDGIRACDNRCPHEGYPLSQGHLSEDCTLTCNWHNWKFNLDSGENFFGGDKLRIYPTEIRNGEIWVDLKDPPYEVRYNDIMNNLHDAFDDNAYDRIGRELARLIRLGSDPLDALRETIQWSWQRMEFGWTHAFAGMADWLVLYDQNKSKELKLVCLMEAVAHVADDVLREQEYPFTQESIEYDESIFLQAIEDEDENTAIASIRGGLNAGLGFSDFERALTHAALAHYNDFGHSLIYVNKAGALIERLGQSVTMPLLLSLVREMIFAPREDQIPEFKAYSGAVKNWGKGTNESPSAELWHRRGIRSALKTTVNCSSCAPEKIYPALLEACAISLLSYDIEQQNKTHVTVSGNVSWLDFTHGITFANAVRKQCSRFPELWPQGLLQMACFTGRNAAYTTEDYDLDQWAFEDTEKGIASLISQVFDHGQDEFIVSVHLLKTALSAREEIERLSKQPEGDQASRLLAAALNRFINSPLKRKQTRRTAYQSMQFVAKE